MTRSTATTTKTICEPWDAIRYTSKNKQSRRYAGPDLASDLAKHNLTGVRLQCEWAKP